MSRAHDRFGQPVPTLEGDMPWAQHELAEAHKTIRSLLRQIDKEQERYKEIVRAYNLTVANLVETTHENSALERERDMWKARAEGAPAAVTINNMLPALMPDEISAIRKAMARLHHPDTGGDCERLKAWNAALDALES